MTCLQLVGHGYQKTE